MAFSSSPFANCDNFLVCMGTWANTVTDGIFWTLMLIGIGIVLFLATFNFGVNRAFGFGAISAALSALFLIQLQWIPTWVLTMTLIVGVIGIVVMLMGER